MENTDDIKSCEIVLSYPVEWEYKTIVEKSVNLEEIIKSILKNRDYKIKASKTSKEGSYKSYSVKTLVHSDEDRVSIYEEIRSHKNVKMVL